MRTRRGGPNLASASVSGLTRGRAVRDGMAIALAVLAGLRIVSEPLPFDTFQYWSFNIGDPYSRAALGDPAFLYSPLAAQLLVPFHVLPWPVFLTGWTLLLLAAAVYQLRPHLLTFVLLPFAGADLWVGNIHLLLGAMAVIALRRPNAWAFGAFSKVTPAMGLLWPLARGRSREVVRVAALIAVLSTASFAFSPSWWFGWFDLLFRSLSVADPWVLPVPLVVRLPAALALVIWAARSNRAWLVPLAILLGLPAIRAGSLALLLAVPPLLAREASPSPGRDDAQAA